MNSLIRGSTLYPSTAPAFSGPPVPRVWLYRHRPGLPLEEKIFEGEEAVEAALEDGWQETRPVASDGPKAPDALAPSPLLPVPEEAGEWMYRPWKALFVPKEDIEDARASGWSSDAEDARRSPIAAPTPPPDAPTPPPDASRLKPRSTRSSGPKKG